MSFVYNSRSSKSQLRWKFSQTFNKITHRVVCATRVLRWCSTLAERIAGERLRTLLSQNSLLNGQFFLSSKSKNQISLKLFAFLILANFHQSLPSAESRSPLNYCPPSDRLAYRYGQLASVCIARIDLAMNIHHLKSFRKFSKFNFWAEGWIINLSFLSN